MKTISCSFPLFGLPEDQFAILNVIHGEFQHLTDPHASPGHQFKHQPVADFDCPKNDLINGFLFDDFPSGDHSFPRQLADHRCIAGIPRVGIDVVFDEIEKR